MPLNLEDHLFIQTRSVVSRVVGGETLVVPVRGKVGDLASIYSFNGTGTLIWQLLASPKPLSDLVEALEHEYAVETSKAHHDVTQFLNDMLSAGLIEIRPRVELPLDLPAAELTSRVEMEAAG
ncbi:MAG TPA: PqqD family protein [Candidatus Binatia bacterium]|nr:PqqD family protein [Candidatus Binatia bacterium]